MLKVLAKVKVGISDITFYFMMGAKKHIHFLSRLDTYDNMIYTSANTYFYSAGNTI